MHDIRPPPSARDARRVRAARHALLTATATACALVGGPLVLPATTAAAAPVKDPAASVPRATAHDITLVTGDVVHFADRPGTAQDTVTVDRPEGATGGVKIQQSGGRRSVVPDEAEALLTAGRLDRRLPSIDAAALRAAKATARTFWKDVAGAAPRARSLDGGRRREDLAARAPAACRRRQRPLVGRTANPPHPGRVRVPAGDGLRRPRRHGGAGGRPGVRPELIRSGTGSEGAVMSTPSDPV
ncbi:hypothetical protein ACFV3E_15950 [Streptomyces sp. NPDC059718]